MPDYVKLAEAFGALGFRAETEEEVDARDPAGRSRRGGRCVIDFRVDHEEKVYPMVPAGAASTDMIDEPVGQRLGRGGRLMHHTLCVLVENQPGVLARVAGLFSRRGFNIESLAVGPTEREDRSRITLRVDCSQHSIDQVIKQLYKLINVLKVNEMTPTTRSSASCLIVRVDGAAGRSAPTSSGSPRCSGAASPTSARRR